MREMMRTLSELFAVLPRGARPFYIWYSIVTGILALVDSAALALIVVVVTPLVSGKPISLPLIGELPQSATVWVVLLICALFIVKGILAILLHWVATRRFARYELQVGQELFRAYANSSWEKRSQLSTAEVTRIVDSSMANTNMGFILPISQIPGNALSFISVLGVLVIAQPMTALIAFLYLGLIFLVMSKLVTKHARLAGRHNREYAYRVATIMTEMVDALKEITLRGKIEEVGEVITKNRRIAVRARANSSFLGIIPKYSLESALIGGFVLIGGAAYLMGGPEQAVVAVALFAASGFRMIPAINAVQGALTSASANEAFARDVIRHLREAKAQQEQRVDSPADVGVLPDQLHDLVFDDVSFTYPRSDSQALSGVSLDIPIGSSVAIVGPSGAGKSTLIDILLGLSLPQQGELRVDGQSLGDVLNQWRARIGYVPQRVSLFDATIAQNVALTWEDDFDRDRVVRALERADLHELIERGNGIDEKIGERGSSISGGQQQRLGIARALYSDPFVMVMDEATSALDTATENRITESMKSLQGEVTFVTVAHRLSTIRHYDQVVYIDDGQIKGSGTFEELVEALPDFGVQARLAGLA